jgi:valyl-tRNA synthetase
LANAEVIQKLANISEINFNQKTDKPSFTFLVGANEFSIPLSENLDLGEEKAKDRRRNQISERFLDFG